MKTKNMFILGALICTTSSVLASSAPTIITQPESQTVGEGSITTYPNSNGTTKSMTTNTAQNDYIFTMVDYDGGAKGDYDYDAETGVFSVRGCGADVWGTNDHFSYLYSPVFSDFSLTVKLNDFPASSNEWAKAGLMVRESAADGTFPNDSRYVAIHTQSSYGIPGDINYRSVWRNQIGESVGDDDVAIGNPYSYPNWQKIERVGNVIRCYYSENGKDWNKLSEIETDTWESGSIGYTLPLYVGMFVTSHNADSNDACAYFSEVNFMEVDVKPIITIQPRSQTITEGSSVTLSVGAKGTTPLSYQWYKGSSKISGATSSTYKISSVKTSDAGSYKVIVSNSIGSVTSSTATLTVYDASQGFIVTCYQSNEYIGDTDAAEACIANLSYWRAEPLVDVYSVINFNDFCYNHSTYNENHFKDMMLFPCQSVVGEDIDNFVILAEADVIIPNAGYWSFGVESDDGFILDIKGNGVNFSSSYSGERAAADTITSFAFPIAGSYHIRLLYFEAFTSSSLDLYAAKGQYDSFNDSFRLVGDIANGGLEVRNGIADVKPTITTQPKSQTVNAGSSVTFSVTATGTEPLSYQWYKGSSKISGATSSSYKISSVTTSDAGSYKVVVSNSAGSVTSSTATLTVNVPVTLSSITINGSSSVDVGSTTTYTCIATYSNGTTKTVTPTWSINSVGTSYASITAAGVLTGKAAGTATIQAKYTDGGVIKTATKSVTVNAVVVKPSITTQPKSQTVNEGSSVTFSVTASGTTPLSYQWYKGSSKISGATSSTYTISSAKSSDAGSYTVTVSNSAGSVTSSAAVLTVTAKPTITTQPKSQTVNEGDSVTFSVVATGTGLSYQWKKGGSNISGATSSTYKISSAKTSDAGSYTVTVSNSAGSVTSSAAALTVTAKPTITTQPKSQTVNEGSSVTFSVTASGTAPLSYQWKKNGSNISGATSSSYTISSAKTNDAGSYMVTVSNSAGSVTSSAATLTVTAKPAITTQPKSQTVNEGSSVTFSVVATGTGLKYQWKKNGSNISGATGSSYTISSVKTSDAGSYTVTVSNSAGSVTSSAATLTVNAAVVKPAITTQPKSQTVYEGSSVTFSVTATGTAPLTYQWKKNGSNISGATKSSYTISSTKTSDAGSYTVTVSNTAGSVISDEAKLTVNKQVVPDGTAVRSIRVDGLTATVTLKLTPNDAVNVYFVEENIPAIGTIIPNDGGVYTPAKNVIRWSFLDNVPREVSYTVTVSSNLDEIVYVGGEVAFDTTIKSVTGDNELDFMIKTHPADTNEDFEISMLEVSSYAVAWKLGQSWSREPADIPMSYVSRAALIWVNGGDYIYDANKSKPACWVNITARAASEELAAASTCERWVSPMGDHSIVTLTIIPAEGISVYLVEEQLPAGVPLNVTDISGGGNYIPEKNVIRWSFLDGEIRMLEYTLEPKDGFTGTISLSGEVMFDEEIYPIEGMDEVEFTAGPLIQYDLQPNNTLVLYFTGTLYESEDMVNWKVVEDKKSVFVVDTSKGKKFYRCAQ